MSCARPPPRSMRVRSKSLSYSHSNLNSGENISATWREVNCGKTILPLTPLPREWRSRLRALRGARRLLSAHDDIGCDAQPDQVEHHHDHQHRFQSDGSEHSPASESPVDCR